MKYFSFTHLSVNWFLVFMLVNCTLLGGFIWLVQSKIDNYGVSETAVLGPRKGESFIYPLALKQDDGTFLQLAYKPLNTKVSLFVAPTDSSTEGVVGLEHDIERVFQALRTYQPGVPHAIQPDIFAFLRGQFDMRRALIEEVITIQGTRFLRVLVNKKDHYIIGLMSRPDAQVAIVAFSPDHAISPAVIQSLFQEYPEFYEKWRVES